VDVLTGLAPDSAASLSASKIFILLSASVGGERGSTPLHVICSQAGLVLDRLVGDIQLVQHGEQRRLPLGESVSHFPQSEISS
jgi:hypothetical protein